MKMIMFAVPTVALQARPAPFRWFKETPTGHLGYYTVPTLTFSSELNKQERPRRMQTKTFYSLLISIKKCTPSQPVKKRKNLPKDILMNHV